MPATTTWPQFVLEVLEKNVERGSRCYEQGHSVVLAWCESSHDIAQVWGCLPARATGHMLRMGTPPIPGPDASAGAELFT